MIDLEHLNESYIIPSMYDDSAYGYLASKDYQFLYIKEYSNQNLKDSFISFSNISNDELRNDSLFILDNFQQDFIIIKYKGEKDPRKIYSDGQESLLEVLLFNSDSNLTTYVFEGVSFSFLDKKIYKYPTKKEDLKNGMIVEYCSNNNWVQRKISNIDLEYDKFYKLLVKYGRVRI